MKTGFWKEPRFIFGDLEDGRKIFALNPLSLTLDLIFHFEVLWTTCIPLEVDGL